MPKICEPCRYYSADNAPTECPTCAGTLRLTMLPPQWQAAEPLPEAAPDTPRTRNRHPTKEGFLEGLGLDRRVIGAVMSVALGLALFAYRQYDRHTRYERVEPGMHISEAAELLDTGRGMHHPETIRFRDRFAPDDASSGSSTLMEGGNEIVVHWKNGFVTAVERQGSGSGGGMRRRATIVKSGPADDVNEDDD